MLRLLTILLLITLPALAGDCPAKVRIVSGNFSDDLAGQPDTRPGTWGTAGVAYHQVAFHPPAGCAVKILSISGDVVAWIRDYSYGQAGVLVGIHRQMWGGKNPWAACDYCSEDTPFYRQMAVSEKPETTTFDHAYRAGWLVGPDNTLWFKHAVWLNDTGQPVHLETTWTIEFQWTPAPVIPVRQGLKR